MSIPTSLNSATGLEQSMLAKIFLAFPTGKSTKVEQLKPNPIPLRSALIGLLSVTLLVDPARAAEIRLLSAASMQTVLKEIIGNFERDSGHKVIIQYSTMGAITDRVMSGEKADLVISSPASMSTLAVQGKINFTSQVTFAKTGIGIVIPSGNTKPEILSVENFKRALLGAKVVVYANPAGGGAAGIHVARVIEKLGIAEQLRPKIKFGAGGDVTEVTLAQGDGAIGITQVSEIVGKTGAEFVAVPDELQNYTGFTAGKPTGAERSDAVDAFMQFLQSPAAATTMKAKGMQPN
jgi:molybdate transport system substrate-binding protein